MPPAATTQEGIVDERSLRAFCEAAIGLLDLPHRFTQAQLIAAAERFIGMPIVYEPVDMRRRKSCGMRKRYADREVIEYERYTSTLHQLVILAHEIAHVILKHQGLEDLAEVQSDEELAEEIDWSVLGLSRRTSYEDQEEREAEMLATMILHRVYRNRELPPLHPEEPEERWEAAFTRPIKERRT
jgi:hypothetical protein